MKERGREREEEKFRKRGGGEITGKGRTGGGRV